MKKIISAIMLVLLCCLAVLPAAACNTNNPMVGKFRLYNYSGYFVYYQLDFSSDLTIRMRAKVKGMQTEIENYGTYTFEDGVVKINMDKGTTTLEGTYEYDILIINSEIEGAAVSLIFEKIEAGSFWDVDYDM